MKNKMCIENRKMKNIHIYILISIFILYILLQYHNYCSNNKLRHTMFETLESIGLYKKGKYMYFVNQI